MRLNVRAYIPTGRSQGERTLASREATVNLDRLSEVESQIEGDSSQPTRIV
jgi:hypothetical protein